MSINVENLFVRSADQAAVMTVVHDHLKQPAEPPHWALPSSAAILARDPKRKVAVSAPKDGWIAIVESREVVDFALAQGLSLRLQTEIAVIQIAEVAGSFGMLACDRGQVIQERFDDHNTSPLASARAFLADLKVPFDFILFRECVGRTAVGWKTL